MIGLLFDRSAMTKQQQKRLDAIKRLSKKPKLTPKELLRLRRNQWEIASDATTGENKRFAEGMAKLMTVFGNASKGK